MDDYQQMTGQTTGSGGLPAPRSAPSRIQPWADRQEALRPATAEDFHRELTSCLILVAPTGMSDDDRTEWLIAARAALDGIPADLLARGAAVARKYCDHPSRIVAQIMREIEEPWNNRKKAVRGERPERPHHFAEGPRQIVDVVTPEQIAEIKAEFGIVTNPYPEQRKPTGVTPRKPTREDYIALGVPAETLDHLTDQRDEAA